MNLNGLWKLYFAKHDETDISTPENVKKSGVDCIDAAVPGNVELDLSKAGILPDDLFKGNNIMLTEDYECYDWYYERSFVPENLPDGKKAILNFHAVDCYATYFLNGEEIGNSDNMFIEHKFDVTDKLVYGRENTVSVYIRSALSVIVEKDTEVAQCALSWLKNGIFDGNTRKAAHGFGWDIMPRALSAGIWRDVTLDYEDVYGFKYIYFDTVNAVGSYAKVNMYFDCRLPLDMCFKKLKFVITGKCGDSEFTVNTWSKGHSGKVYPINLDNVKLWWPRNYGAANMYDINVKAYLPNGELACEGNVRYGFRSIKLKNTALIDEKGGEFRFIVNNTPIQIIGTNWVPMDAFHSRDKERYTKAFELAADVNVNMIRCWGGNVYEDTEFYDFCDDNGILVWQDFGFACCFPPQTDEFFKKIEIEAESVIKKLRTHSCLALWSGDNEIDMLIAQTGTKPSVNRITREILPNLLTRHDPTRIYLPSSPYIPDELTEKYNTTCFDHYVADCHLWGPRDYFKNTYYTQNKSPFLSEIGYHGSPSEESIKKFIDLEYLWPYKDNEQWNLHSSDQYGDSGRVMLMHNQIRQLFGIECDNLTNFVAASQISQAEAYKFYIERVRLNMNYFGGIIWWNLVDGWPQMSDAVVDYYYDKKLAYYYIKRSSRPFIVAINERNTNGYAVTCCNATKREVKGKVTVADLETGKVLLDARNFISPANGNNVIANLPLSHSAKGMLMIKWETEEGTFFNNYLYGYPAFDVAVYQNNYNKFLEEERKYYEI